MAFGLVFFGIVVGKLWTSLVSRCLESCSRTRKSIALHLGAYVGIAIVSGGVIGLLEQHMLVPAANALSKGLIGGFLWSTWFIAPTRELYARHQVAQSIAYLVAAPAFVAAGTLGGYVSSFLKPSLT